MDSPPRMQHYVPVWYLKNFAQKEKLNVCDLLTDRKYVSKPENVAKIRDFYTVQDEHGQDDYSVERHRIGEIEAAAAPVIKRIRKEGTIKSPQDRSALDRFIALQELRVPKKRQAAQETCQHLADIMAHSMCASESVFENAVQMARKESGFTEELDYTDFKQMVDDRRFSVELQRDCHVWDMLQLLPIVTELVSRMTLTVFFTRGRVEFISGDVPIVKTDANRRDRTFLAVGWCTPSVEVYMPLSKQCCIMLSWAGTSQSSVECADERRVAFVNTLVAHASSRYLFWGSSKGFGWMDGTSRITRDWDAFWQEIGRHKAQEYAVDLHGGGVARRPVKHFHR